MKIFRLKICSRSQEDKMTKIKTQILKKHLRKSFGFFVLYAFLPLIFLGVIASLLFIRSVGAKDAQAVFATVKNESVVSLLGNKIQKKEVTCGFYFPSSELLLPSRPGVFMMAGSAHYFFTEKEHQKEKETIEKKPEIIYDSLPAAAKPIIKSDLSSSSFVINTTNYTVNVEEAREATFPSETERTSAPLVLVLHTHGTESYFEDRTNLSEFASDGVESYFLEEETSFRTTDPEKSVVSVGKSFADELNKLGIPTLHCTVMHDAGDFNNAYINSAETVKQYLKEYPSIQYVIDLHRDSVVRGEAFVKSFAKIEGMDSAQVMLVVGTNQNGRHPNWKENLIVATSFKDTMDSLYPSLSRSLYLRTSRFNQEYLPGCMLLEVGSAANTLEEAKRASLFAARAFAQMLQNETEVG